MPRAEEYLDATPKCPRTFEVTKHHGNKAKAVVQEPCLSSLIWIHGLHGYGSWHCSHHGHIDEARPHARVEGDSREGLKAA